MFATMSYFAMATGDGISYHKSVEREQHSHHPDTEKIVYRQVYWARYVDWALTTPLLLLDLCLVAGLNGANITMALVADEIMILTGLFAAFGNEGTPQKWGWYAMACVAYLVVIWHLALHGRAEAMKKSSKLGGFFAAIGGFTLILWTAYPVYVLACSSRPFLCSTNLTIASGVLPTVPVGLRSTPRSSRMPFSTCLPSPSSVCGSFSPT